MFSVNNYPHFPANEKTWLVTGAPSCHGLCSFVKVKEISIISGRWAISVCAMFKDTKNHVLMHSMPQEGPNNEPLCWPIASLRTSTVFHAGASISFSVSLPATWMLTISTHPISRLTPGNGQSAGNDSAVSPQLSVIIGLELVGWLRRKQCSGRLLS